MMDPNIPNECDECNQQFANQQALKEHLDSSAHIKQILASLKRQQSTSAFSVVQHSMASHHHHAIHPQVEQQSQDIHLPLHPSNRDLSSHSTDGGSRKKQMLNTPDDFGIGPSIVYSSEYMVVLQSFVPSAEILRKNGHVLEQLSDLELHGKKRCQGCGKCMRKLMNGHGKADSSLKSLDAQHSDKPAASTTAVKPKQPKEPKDLKEPKDNKEIKEDKQRKVPKETKETKQPQQPMLRCKYHPGFVRDKKWSCCGNHVSSDPCAGSEYHVPRQYPKGEIESLWKFFATPAATRYSDIHPAIALDCEMGTSASGDSELIRLSVIDYFSSEVLVDNLVWPDVKMDHYNTRFSGVTVRDMENARAKGTCFRGRDKAREAVWRFVGPTTLVVGHSVDNDLIAMRWIHPMVVDTLLIESTIVKAAKDKQETAAKEKVARELREAEVTSGAPDKDEQKPGKEQKEKEAELVIPPITADGAPKKVEQKPPKKPKGFGPKTLKTLAMAKLGREIQGSGKKGHDSVEDALAARDLAHWYVLNKDMRLEV